VNESLFLSKKYLGGIFQKYRKLK